MKSSTYRNPPGHSDVPSLSKIQSALAAIPSDQRDIWLRVGMALKSELGDSGFDLWDAWSQTSDSYRASDARSAWKSFKSGKISIGTLFFHAKAYGWNSSRDYREISQEELAERRRVAERARVSDEAAELQRQADVILKTVMPTWMRASDLKGDGHPYLLRKQVQSHQLRVGDWTKSKKTDAGWKRIVISNALLVPMIDEEMKLWNLQAIFSEPPSELGRDKDYVSGARKSGLFFPIGEDTPTVLIAEGYATAATLFEQTGFKTFVAFDCGNLGVVALVVRKHYPDARIIIAADNDSETKGNPGVTKACEAAQAIGGLVSFPQFPEGVSGTDWNDIHVYQLHSGNGGDHGY